ncbi:RimJ/RimL family protein N-acetyltransferase [Agrobacterium tumefaciens]|uniref:RimJ/RimL family protein N-acetyltransferase n=1 Tax=Agrobacterium tumefaciens TaxID=358 RepID=A0AAW8LSL7_AGRTU|nr:GNAT family protein [Agrobacterium tumefaciens]MBP2564639.1 RimJ/RimL family protein N-acetyltransferase [Agrobacterium tumefaciens]MDR6701496.1 RimJ/RimL family protein N-acetyltransferase [Agrobacterium tumefaciens]
MKEVVYSPTDEMLTWATNRGGIKFRDDAAAIGLRSDHGLHGVIVFDSFTTTGCWVSVVSDGGRKWITRELIIKVFAYPFIQLGYPRLNSFVSVNNADAIRFNEHFGFQREGILREAGEHGEDLIVYGMLRRECRWLPERFAGKTGKPAL